ncbi:hydrogenase small subunit [Helicobacter kayseriensis]|uniref:hydrogenase small subunit n=1 Tax=Helicobacter kayseriensis TaxID=2905877 RepID=UPI001E3759D9|nr:hydrogenase small subunit [Helicobacter kayseriensis]MCE3046838.1 hydrogenase small subunit [Helicobacter kayseriensis]MCE3047860.1 hydrogenase small subunit [Helicobacter kayseriensis]
MQIKERERIEKRLEELEKMPSFKEEHSIAQMLQEKGISRRDFMKWAGGIATMLALSPAYTPLIAKAAELSDRLPVIWLNLAECTGCSESLTRSEFPSIDSLIFDYISLEYHETLMAPSGWQAELSLQNAMEKYKGRYILMVEGGVPFGDEGRFLTIGAHAQTGKELAKDAISKSAAVFAIGTCSSFGGVQAAYPNPTNAKPLSSVSNRSIINVPGCPPSERNIVGTLMYYVLFGNLPALDAYSRPTWAYGTRIHDLCERRGRFDAGEFVENFGDEGAKKGYCLYKVGCKGPYTFNNCSVSKFNSGVSWPIQAGHGCIGCSEPNFWDTMAPYEKPLADRSFQSVFGGMGADWTADKVGLAVLTATAIGIAAHATIMKIKESKGE